METENIILDELLDQVKLLKVEDDELSTEHVTDYINKFETWADTVIVPHNTYAQYVLHFDAAYREELFHIFCFNMHNSELISDTCLFYWKMLVLDLIMSHKKYMHRIGDISYDATTKTSNMKLERCKHVFRCYSVIPAENPVEEFICHFKENENGY